MTGKGLRLQALMNSFVHDYTTGDDFRPSVTALRLFALTHKSLSNSMWAPTNARELVIRHNCSAMDKLKSAAGGQDGSAAPSHIAQQARRLKELTHELRRCSGRELSKVQSARVARQVCKMFKLGDEAYRTWEQQRHLTASSSTDASRRKGSPSPSPAKQRSKRKMPEKLVGATRSSRFAAECGQEEGAGGALTAAVDGEPPRRRRSSGEDDSASLLPKQHFGGSGAATAPPSPAPQPPCADWALFKTHMASPRRPGPAASAVAPQLAHADPAPAAPGLYHVSCSTTDSGGHRRRHSLGLPTPFAVAVRAAAAPEQEQEQEQEQPMDVDGACRQAEKLVRASQAVLSGQLASAAPAPAPASAPAPVSGPALPAPLSPRQPPAAGLPAAPLFTPDKLTPWGLPLRGNKENGTIGSGGGGMVGSARGGPGSIASCATPPSDCQWQPCTAVDRALLMFQSPATERAAAAMDIIAADVLTAFSDCSWAGQGHAGSPTATTWSSRWTGLDDGATSPHTSATPMAFAMPAGLAPAGHDVAVVACAADSIELSLPGRHGAPPQDALMMEAPLQPQLLRQRASAGTIACSAGDRVLLADKDAVRRQAAQPPPPPLAGNLRDLTEAFQALNGHGRAHSILRPLQVPLSPAALYQQEQAAGGTSDCCCC